MVTHALTCAIIADSDPHIDFIAEEFDWSAKELACTLLFMMENFQDRIVKTLDVIERVSGHFLEEVLNHDIIREEYEGKSLLMQCVNSNLVMVVKRLMKFEYMHDREKDANGNTALHLSLQDVEKCKIIIN